MVGLLTEIKVRGRAHCRKDGLVLQSDIYNGCKFPTRSTKKQIISWKIPNYMIAISISFDLLQQFHVFRKRKSGSLKTTAHTPGFWGPSLFFQCIQHIILADIEPHTKKQVVPAGLHEEEAAGAQMRAHCHGLWHGGVRESLHPA